MKPLPPIALTLVPPGPVTDKIDREVRGTFKNETGAVQSIAIEVYLGSDDRKVLFGETRQLQVNQIEWFSFYINTAGLVGRQLVTLECKLDNEIISCQQELDVIPSDNKSTGLISGAWLSLLFWSDAEGAKWNDLQRTVIL